MDRKLWTQKAWVKSIPPWPCPTCGQSAHALVDKSWKTRDTKESNELQEDPHSELEWISQRASALLACGYCGETVAIVGLGHVVDHFSTHTGSHYVLEVWPDFISPPIPIVHVPQGTPEAVNNALRRSFGLYWSNPGAAATTIRQAVELMLDVFGVSRESNAARPARLSLHRRLGILAETDIDTADRLRAIKWIGNSGAHDSVLKHEDTLDAYEILEHVLDEKFHERHARVALLTAKINAARGPR